MSSICTVTSWPTIRLSGLRIVDGVVPSVEMSTPLSVAISMSSDQAVLTTMSIVGIWGVYAPTCRTGAASSLPSRIIPSLSASRLATDLSMAISPPATRSQASWKSATSASVKLR